MISCTNSGPALADGTVKKWTIDSLAVQLPKYYTRGVFTVNETERINLFYSKLCDVPVSSVEVPSMFQYITINGRLIGSYKSRSSSSSTVMACPHHTSPRERPARIRYFAKHTAVISGCEETFLLFRASWFKAHRDKEILGNPVTA